MRVIHTKTIAILIAGAVFAAGLIMSFGGYVFAGNYNSSLSNKDKAIVRMEVGNVLLRYGVGGMEINRVNDALDIGITKDKLTVILTDILVNVGPGTASGEGVSDKIQAILLEFDKIGIGDTPQPAPATGTIEVKDTASGEVSTPDATGAVPRAAGPPVPGIDISLDEIPAKRAEPASATIKLMQDTIGKIQERLKDCDNIKVCDIVEDHAKQRADVTDTTQKAIENRNWEEATRLLHEVRGIVVGDIKLLESVEDKGLIADVLGLERALLNQTDSALKKMSALKLAPATTPQQPSADEARENVKKYRRVLLQQGKVLRDNFRENVRTTIGHVDHGKTGRIALAHGKGLRMINRYRSAIARFDHILGRLESRFKEISGIESETQQAPSEGTIKQILPSAILLIEEAKNIQALNKAKLAELEAKYESLLLGKNSGGVAEEAREIAKELKSEIEKLHGLLDDIRQEAVEQLKANPRH